MRSTRSRRSTSGKTKRQRGGGFFSTLKHGLGFHGERKPIHRIILEAPTDDKALSGLQTLKVNNNLGDVNALTGGGKTALMIATGKGFTNTVQFLKELGANSDIQNIKGRTAQDYENEYKKHIQDIQGRIKGGDSGLLALIERVCVGLQLALSKGEGVIEVPAVLMPALDSLQKNVISWKTLTEAEKEHIIKDAASKARHEVIQTKGRAGQSRVGNYLGKAGNFKRTNVVAVEEQKIFDELMSKIDGYEPINLEGESTLVQSGGGGDSPLVNPYMRYANAGDINSMINTYIERHRFSKTMFINGYALRSFAFLWGLFLVSLKILIVTAFSALILFVIVCIFVGGGDFGGGGGGGDLQPVVTLGNQMLVYHALSSMSKSFDQVFSRNAIINRSLGIITVSRGLSYMFPTSFRDYSAPASFLYIDYELDVALPTLFNKIHTDGKINLSTALPGFGYNKNRRLVYLDTDEEFHLGTQEGFRNAFYLSARWTLSQPVGPSQPVVQTKPTNPIVVQTNPLLQNPSGQNPSGQNSRVQLVRPPVKYQLPPGWVINYHNGEKYYECKARDHTQWDPPTEECLPLGWIIGHNERGEKFYGCYARDHTQFDRPTEECLPCGWEIRYTTPDKKGKKFYACTKTGKTQWELPKTECLPPGWTIGYNERREKFYVCKGNRQRECPTQPC
jgi:hypothetical protein